MPGIGGVETTRRLLQTAPETKVLAVSGLAEEPYPSLLLKAGAKGYITKGAPVTEMVRAINKVMQGGNISALILLNNWPVLIYRIHKPRLLMLCLNVKCR